MESDLQQTVNFEACWLVCFIKEHECPQGWVSQRQPMLTAYVADRILVC